MEHLAARLAFLASSQNPDGGWGYFPGKQSWLEPTVYAALALFRIPAAAGPVSHAWRLIRSWQNADGGWRPSARVDGSGWCTALAVTLGDTLGEPGSEISRGVDWLVSAAGAESSTLNRLLRLVGASAVEREVKYAGWPWRPDTSAWVEPTAHSLIALKKVARRNPSRRLAARIDSGERMLLSVRCADGGWNYGSPRALGIELSSYMETTALALAGLQDRAPEGLVEHARDWLAKGAPPLARAWLRLAAGAPPEDVPLTHQDIQLCALEALDFTLLRAGAPS